MALRRHSDLRGRRLTLVEALTERFAMSELGYRYLLHVAPHLDRLLIPRTKGRLSSAGVDKVGLVTTTGAKTGQRRTQPLALIEADDSLLAVGSNYGRPSHPSWSANLLAHCECEVEFGGPSRPYRAELLTGAEREEAWAQIVDFYAGYDRYRVRCAPRTIRVFRLRSHSPGSGSF